MTEQNTQPQINIKKLGFFPGCIAQTEQYAEELALRAILPQLDIEPITPQGLSCCGGPLRSINRAIPQYLAVRNLALFEQENLTVLTPCPQCHLVFTRVLNHYQQQPEQYTDIQTKLKDENLTFTGKTTILHTVNLLYDHVGLDTLKKHIKKPFKQQQVAAHYGCHLIRPSSLPRPDHPEQPTKIEHILQTLGLKTANYPERLNCCGAPIYITHQETALTKTGQKLTAIQNHQYDALTVACPWGYRMFDTRQESAATIVGEKLAVPIYTLSQLVGLALDITPEKLGIHLNKSPRGTLLTNATKKEGA